MSFNKIEFLETTAASMRRELDELRQQLDDEKKMRAYDTERHWNAICDLRFELQEMKEKKGVKND